MSLHPQSCNEKEILSQNGTKPLFCNSGLFSYPDPIFMIHTSHEPGETPGVPHLLYRVLY